MESKSFSTTVLYNLFYFLLNIFIAVLILIHNLGYLLNKLLNHVSLRTCVRQVVGEWEKMILEASVLEISLEGIRIRQVESQQT